MLDMSMESPGGKYTVVRLPASASDSNPEKWRVRFDPLRGGTVICGSGLGIDLPAFLLDIVSHGR